MMTGIPNVNSIIFFYHAGTLLFLLFIALYDIRHHKIRNTALFALFLWCLFSIPITLHVCSAVSMLQILLRSTLGFVTGFFLLLFISITTNGSIGGGDIKLTGVLGIMYGAFSLMTILFISCLLILLHYFLYKFLKRGKMESIPFAPYLFLGCTICMLPQLCNF